MKWYYFIIMTCLLISCKKEEAGKVFTIKGMIVESSGNPVPVSNYSLQIYQIDRSSFMGGVLGFDKNIITGDDGSFTFKYNPHQNFGFSKGGTNSNNITLIGRDLLKFKDLNPTWSPIPALIDTNLGTVYLYKKIKTVVRKIQFDNNLEDGENLEVITSNSPRSDYKTITGPVAAGTILTLDPILNCRLNWLFISTQQYKFRAVLKKPSYSKDLIIPMSNMDEESLEVFMVY